MVIYHCNIHFISLPFSWDEHEKLKNGISKIFCKLILTDSSVIVTRILAIMCDLKPVLHGTICTIWVYESYFVLQF